MVKVTPNVKSQIVRKYLHHISMGQIAKETGASKTTVFNVVHEWTLKMAVTDLDEIRFFLSEMRRSGITIQQCVQGFRIEQVLQQFNVKDEFDEWTGDEDANDTTDSTDLRILNSQTESDLDVDFDRSDDTMQGLARNRNEGKNRIGKNYYIYNFINDIYKNCKEHRISPEMIVKWLLDLFEFYALTDKKQISENRDYHALQFEDSNDNDKVKRTSGSNADIDTEIPFISKVSFFLIQKKNHIRNLDNTKKSINSDIHELKTKKNNLISELNSVIQKRKTIFSYFNWYQSLKNELYVRYRIILENNIENMVNVMNDFKNYEFDVTKLISEYNYINSLVITKGQLQQQIDYDRTVKSKLQGEINTLSESVNYYTQTINTYQELFKIGCGLKELKKLTNIIYESAFANEIDVKDSVKEFFRNVEEQYDNKLGFEKKINELRAEMEKMKLQVPEYKFYLRLQGIVSPTLIHLNNSGVTNEDIIEMNHLVLEFKNSDFLSDPLEQNQSNKVTGMNDSQKKLKYWTLFINKLKNLKNINKELNKQISKIHLLNEQITSLGSKKEELESAYVSAAKILNDLISKNYESITKIKRPEERIIPKPIFVLVFNNFDSSNGSENNTDDEVSHR